MIVSRIAGVALACFALVVACGSSTSSPSCDDLQAQARDDVSKAIASHLGCAIDSDCQTTAFSAQCFDSCSRAIAKSGTADVDAARARVNADACKRFADQGCKATIPPCDPGEAPKCVSGTCK